VNILLKTRSVAAMLVIASVWGRPNDSAEAGFIASSLGPNNSYNMGDGYNLTGPKAFTGVGYGLAVRFTVGGTSPVAFGSSEMAIAYRGGTNAFDVVLATDNGGLPGTALETIHLANLSPNPSLVLASSTAHPLLAAGSTYWLEAIAVKDTVMTWLANTQGPMDHLAYRADTGSGPGPWGTAPGDADPAFAVSPFGASPTLASVPTPSSLSLLGIGLIGLAGRGAIRKLSAA